MTETVAAIVIGRNEGARLEACFASLEGKAAPVIYVDSGSTDGSLAVAKAAGAHIVELDMTAPFTAARARNMGLAALTEVDPDGTYVQFVDGDCQVREGWLTTACAALEADVELAIVCGRRRERFPDASSYNRMIDWEWDTPVGPARESGGDFLGRRTALAAVDGFDAALIAGEEPEMCYRLRQKGWKIERLDAEMTWHDAGLSHWRQWWQRARRAGFSYGALAHLHGAGPERLRVAEQRRALFWGGVIPGVAIIGGLFASTLFFAILLLLPLQIVRLSVKGVPFQRAVFLTASKVPEAVGIVDFHVRRLRGQPGGLIEYK